MKGIDVSSHQGIINWDKVKNQIDFAIIRLGYGDNITSQDDKQFFNNVNGCIANNIPFGVYIYSYAKRITGAESIQSEIEHCKRLLSMISKKPFCVYIDMEDETYQYKLGKTTLTNFALEFCKQITNAGYKAGVYANQNWFINYLNPNVINENGYSLWVAKYSDNKPNISCNYDIWQYSDNGKLDGINDNYVDLNNMINNIIDIEPTPVPINTNVNVFYQVETKEDGILPVVKNLEDYAGWKDYAIRYLAIKVDKGNIKYRVTTISNKTLGWINRFDIKDHKNGCAGNGEPISTVEVYYYTPNNIRPYKKAKYKVNNYGWQYDLEKTNGQDGYAGVKGIKATKFQIEIV